MKDTFFGSTAVYVVGSQQRRSPASGETQDQTRYDRYPLLNTSAAGQRHSENKHVRLSFLPLDDFPPKGMGGGTGTGAAPVIAAAARSMGCVTVAVVTEPFEFEGRQRSRQAAAGLAELRKAADTVLVVANDKLLEIVPGRMTMSDAFLVADDVLRQGVSEEEREYTRVDVLANV